MAPAPHVWLVQGTILAQRALGRRVGSNWFVLPPGTCGAVPELAASSGRVDLSGRTIGVG
jgi:hypothetical protein